MKLLKYFVFGSSTSPFVIALVLSSALTLSSVLILFFSIEKSEIVFNVIAENIVPLSSGLVVIAIVSFIFVYILAIKTKKTEK